MQDELKISSNIILPKYPEAFGGLFSEKLPWKFCPTISIKLIMYFATWLFAASRQTHQ